MRTPTRAGIRPQMLLHALVSLVAAAAAFALLACMLTGCASAPGGQSADGAAGGEKVRVVASFYPMYDFAKKVGGERVEASCLVPAGTEPHDWEPSTADIAELERASVFVYNGAGMEHWVDDTLASLSNSALVSVEASRGIELRSLSAHDEEAKETGGKDPHVWLDPENAKEELANVRDALVKADPAGEQVYQENYRRWAAECDELDAAFSSGLSKVKGRKIVVSHEAFGYLCDAYGLEQLAIEGVEADGEPDAKQMAKIADFVERNGVKTIFSEELVSPKVAQAIARETGASVEQLDPVEGLTDAQLSAGEDYFSVMRANLAALKGALA